MMHLKAFELYGMKLPIFTAPRNFDVNKADEDMQMGLTEFQSDSVPKEKFSDAEV
jgi:hypothetical protein